MTTVKLAVPESPVGLPVAVIVYAPKETALTVKDPTKFPFEIEHDEEATGLPESEQLESLVEKPEPDTLTPLPTEADVVFRVSVGVVRIVMYADEESDSGLPDAVTSYEPAETLATVNDPVTAPLDIMQDSDVTTAPLRLQDESLVEKPVPPTETVPPTYAEVGLKVIDGELVNATLKVADAESSSGVPVAVMEYEVGATLATTNDAVRVPSEIEHDDEATTFPDRLQPLSAVE